MFNLLTTGARVTPEAAGPHKYYPNYLPSVVWTYPATSNILLDAGVSLQALDQNDTREEGFDDTWYRIQDQALNLTYGNVATRTIPRRQFQQRFALSYLTGSHQFKTGVNVKLGRQGDIAKLGFDKTIHGTAVNYRFNNGVPNQLTLLDAPWNFEERVNDVAFYVQDQWTMNRLTLNLGVRYNEVRGSTPEQVLGEGYFVPERRFAALENVPHYRNLSPRLGFAYDLFGTGRHGAQGVGRPLPGDCARRHRQPGEQPDSHDQPDVERRQPQLRARLRLEEPGDQRRMRSVVGAELRPADRAARATRMARSTGSTASTTTGRGQCRCSTS